MERKTSRKTSIQCTCTLKSTVYERIYLFLFYAADLETLPFLFYLLVLLYMYITYDYKYFTVQYSFFSKPGECPARRGGAEVAGWTLDRKIRVRFPAYPHRVWALWWQGGKRRLRTSRCPCRGRLGTLKTPSCPWCGCPAAGQNLETGHLSRHYIAEISLNVTLNHNQQTKNKKRMSKELTS